MSHGLAIINFARQPGLRGGPNVRVVRPSRHAANGGQEQSEIVALLASPATLPQVLASMSEVRPDVVLLRGEGVSSALVARLISQPEFRRVRDLVVHLDPSLPQRLADAWRLGAQSDTILQANVIGSDLEVMTCDLQSFSVPLERIPRVRRANDAEQAAFEVSPCGHYLEWPALEAEFDVEGLRLLVDPLARAAALRRKAAHDRRYGQAIRNVRVRHGLRQTDIDGLSDRQVRRIEKGNFPHISSLQLLAKAHGLATNDYLEEVAQETSRLPEEPSTD